MRIAWYLGFGWVSIATVVASGIAIQHLGAPLGWAFYVPFLVVALYMTVRFRLFSAEPWRRVHGRSMILYAKLAGQAYDEAKRRGVAFDVRVPCRELARHLFPDASAEEIESWVGDERKAYYKALAGEFPEIFVAQVGPERHKAFEDGVRRDVDASELGPDALIARVIERKHGRREAARYLRALLLGRVR